MSNPEQALISRFGAGNVSFSGEGGKYTAAVLSEEFQGLTTIGRHKMVYAVLNPFIASGEVHAVSIEAKTPSEATP